MKLERRSLHLKATGLPSKSMNSVTGFGVIPHQNVSSVRE